MKLAFTFPGQGSQYVGMGKEMHDDFQTARLVFEEAGDILGYDIKKMCFEGPEDDLKMTYNTQPALLTVSTACARILAENGVLPSAVAGHSLGEYSALVAAEAMSFADAVAIVRRRGRFMQDCAAEGGGMAAILSLEKDMIIKACLEASAEGIVEVANFNCPGQVVIAGEARALARAMALCSEYGAKRAIPLAVSGPFHSSLMSEAGRLLGEELDGIEIKDPFCPVISNVTGNVVESAGEIKKLLVRQVSSSVLWDQGILNLVSMGIHTFVEVGPGKVLTGLTKKITKESSLFNVENVTSLEITLDKLKEVL